MRKGLVLFVLGWALVLGGGLVAHLVQTAGGISVRDIRWRDASGASMSALLYVPPNATAATPAPGILAVHGYINTRETQDGFAIELARRGYVVLAMDQSGHGYSDPPAFARGFGGPAGLAYLRSLPMVNKDEIGLEGHSMGGWTVLAAAQAMPDAYRAMVLEGSSTGPPFAADGTPAWPRNLAVVYSRYDEFSPLMWGVDHARDVGQSHKLIKVFGASAPIVAGQVQGAIEGGTARTLMTPAVTHPGDHISSEAIGDAASWFARTLKGGTPRPAGDQIWIWKEIATLGALIGVVVLMLGTLDLLLALPFFADLRGPPAPGRTGRTWRWWAALTLGAAPPVLTYFPLMRWGGDLLGPSVLFRQTITSQIMVWALANAAIALALGLLFRAPKVAAQPPSRLRAALLALAVVATAYAAVWLIGALFVADARFWVVSLKPLGAAQAIPFLVYLAPFTLFFAVILRATHANLAIAGEGRLSAYGSTIAALAGGFAVFLAAQYIPLFVADRLLTPSEPLNVIVAIQFLPLMAIAGLISAFAWRRTGSAMPGALICGLFVTWYITAGTATHWAPGMSDWPRPATAAAR